MIYGIEDVTTGTAPSGPPGAPTLRGTLDFVNNTYDFDTVTSLTLAEVVNLTGRRSASGLEIIAGTPVQLLNDPLDFLLAASWTVVIDFHVNAATGFPGRRLFLATVFDTGFNDQVAIFTTGDGTLWSDLFEDNGAGDTREAFGDAGVAANANYKMACTRVTSHIAVSLAGETIGVDQVSNISINISSWTFPPSQVQIADGNDSGTHEGFIRSIAFYDPVDDSLLPGLST